MDAQTIEAYDTASAQYARDWHEQPVPEDLYALLREYFRPGLTVDIGCGSGRDVAWLNANGFETSGYDASEGLLGEARATYPDFSFGVAVLPELSGLQAGAYQNLLCETVVMHLDASQIGAATQRLLSLLRPSGTMYLSWRVTEGASIRDDNGRLYAAFHEQLVRRALRDAVVLFDRTVISLSSGKKIHRMIVRKNHGGQPDGSA